MAKKLMTAKRIKELVNEAYKKHFDRVQVNMMQIPAIYTKIHTIVTSDESEGTKFQMMDQLVQDYRVITKAPVSEAY